MFRWAAAIFVMAFVFAASAAQAADPAIPQFWDSKERIAKPDLSRYARIRFLTTVDFPPFNFLDANGLISGFHIDLARAICRQLDILERCQIQALPFEELEGALERGEGDALIAGLALTPERRLDHAFTRSYLRFPARFVVATGSTLAEPVYRNIAGRRIGVMAGSEHEKMLRDYFPEATTVPYDRIEWLHDGIRKGQIDAIFGDGLRLSFWLSSTDSAGCCQFAGGPYIAPEYFGAGLAIAVRGSDSALAEAFDYALREINMNGEFEELYLRYFPISFF